MSRIETVLKKIFLNEKLILVVIVLNAIIIYLIDSGVASSELSIVDIVCTIFFMIEMAIKLKELGWKGYWSDGWNRFDGVLVFCHYHLL